MDPANNPLIRKGPITRGLEAAEAGRTADPASATPAAPPAAGAPSVTTAPPQTPPAPSAPPPSGVPSLQASVEHLTRTALDTSLPQAVREKARAHATELMAALDPPPAPTAPALPEEPDWNKASDEALAEAKSEWEKRFKRTVWKEKVIIDENTGEARTQQVRELEFAPGTSLDDERNAWEVERRAQEILTSKKAEFQKKLAEARTAEEQKAAKARLEQHQQAINRAVNERFEQVIFDEILFNPSATFSDASGNRTKFVDLFGADSVSKMPPGFKEFVVYQIERVVSDPNVASKIEADLPIANTLAPHADPNFPRRFHRALEYAWPKIQAVVDHFRKIGGAPARPAAPPAAAAPGAQPGSTATTQRAVGVPSMTTPPAPQPEIPTTAAQENAPPAMQNGMRVVQQGTPYIQGHSRYGHIDRAWNAMKAAQSSGAR